MGKYVYVQGAGKLVEFWQKLSTVGRPSKVDRDWMTRIGYGSKNDLLMVGVLQTLGYVDKDGVPTEKWTSLRVAEQNKSVLGQAIVEHYQDLYEMYPDAHKLDFNQVKEFFRAATHVGETAVNMIAATYRALCSLAGFVDSQPTRSARTEVPKAPKSSKVSGAVKPANPVTAEVAPAVVPQTTVPAVVPSQLGSGSQLGVHINIELHLPATTEADVYEKLFAALRKHLLDS